jgi:putative flippase GtrA
VIERSPTSFTFRPRRTVRFLIVGALGFGVQIAVLETLTSLAGWFWLPATILSVEVAIVHNFLWHARWTWADAWAGRRRGFAVSGAPFDTEVVRFVHFNVASGLTSIAGNVALTALYAGALRVPVIAANGLAVLTMAVVNFVVADRWIFSGSGNGARDSVRLVKRFGRSLVCPVFILLGASGIAPVAADAAPPEETVAAWDRYVAETEARIARGRRDDPIGRTNTRESRGIAPRSIECEGESVSVVNGTISRWRGVVFLPGISLDELLRRLRDPGTPPPQEEVTAARVLSRTSDSLRVYMRLVRKAIVTVSYDTEHEMRFERWTSRVATARSVATRIEEVGGEDHGFLWRLNSYWTYRAVDGGVMVQLESLTLSRNVPVLARPIASPVITRISRESMIRTLEALQRAMS